MSDVDFLCHPYHEPYQKRRKVICLFTFFTSSHDHDDNQDDDNNRSNFSFSLFFLVINLSTYTKSFSIILQRTQPMIVPCTKQL